jgi:hypothetical protein
MAGHHAAKKSSAFTGPRLGLEARHDGKTNGNCNRNNHNLVQVDNYVFTFRVHIFFS